MIFFLLSLKLLADFTVSSNATRVVVITYSSVDRVLRQVDHITPIPKAPCTNDIKTVLMMHGNRRKYRYQAFFLWQIGSQVAARFGSFKRAKILIKEPLKLLQDKADAMGLNFFCIVLRISPTENTKSGYFSRFLKKLLGVMNH